MSLSPSIRLIIFLLLYFIGNTCSYHTYAFPADYNVSNDQTLIIGPEGASYDYLRLGDNATIILNGGRIEARKISSGQRLRITGSGSIAVRDSFNAGKYSVLNLTSVSLELGSAVFSLSPGSTLSLNTFPIKGGKVEFLTLDDGTGVSLSAPCTCIFQSCNVRGRFHCQEAYPEWYAEKEPTDWTPLINQAFEHSADGIVRLQSRIYEVCSTIFMPTRSQLHGTMGLWKNSDSGDPRKEEESRYGTKIVIGENTDFVGECVMLVNFNRSEVEAEKNIDFGKLKKAKSSGSKTYLINHPWIVPTASVSNISFRMNGWNESELPSLCCILVAGSASFDQLSFQKFRQGIVWTDHYADQKSVTRCQFSQSRHQAEGDYYLLDFNFLGDALICEGNHLTSGYSPFNRHLRIGFCNGGNISSNIINGDILITGCKGLRFSDNHLENGVQTIIRNSEVEFSNNYIEKGVRSSVVVEQTSSTGNCVVNMHNNQFIYYSSKRDLLVNGKWTPTVAIKDGGKNNIPLSEVSDYDVELRSPMTFSNGKWYPNGPRALIDISSNYRYWIASSLAGIMYTYGISMCKRYTREKELLSPEPIESFNSRSQLLSTVSTLSFDALPVISTRDIIINNLNSVTVRAIGLNANTRWYGNLADYSYYYQILWDIDKKYTSCGKSSESPVASLGRYSIPEDYSKGILFTLQGASGIGATAMIRMIRKNESTNLIEYADIPLVACNCFYDNGVSVGTYNWKNAGSIDNVTIRGNLPAGPSYIYSADGLNTIPH